MRCHGGCNDYIGFYQSLSKFGKAPLYYAQALRQLNGMCLCAINDHKSLCAVIAQVTSGKFAHLPRPYQKNARFTQFGKVLPCQLYRYMTHRRRIATDPRLASSALACDQRSSEQCRQNGTGILTTLGKFQRLSYLPLNLWFTRHQRIQATCNAEQVEYRFFASEII